MLLNCLSYGGSSKGGVTISTHDRKPSVSPASCALLSTTKLVPFHSPTCVLFFTFAPSR
jgi:hypothetical protein